MLAKPKRILHPNSLANLTPIQKGQVLNPKGGPKKEDSLLMCIEEELAKLSLNGKLTRAQMVAMALVDKAEMGDTRAAELFMSYLHARPTTQVGISGETTLRVIYDGVKEIESAV